MHIDVSAEDTLLADWKAIYSNGTSAAGDLMLTFRSGEKLTMNKAVLAELSPDVAAFMHQLANAVNPKNPQPLSLPEKYLTISGKSWSSLLQYCYYNDAASFDQVSACELIMFAKDMRVAKLVQLLTASIVSGQITAASSCLVLSIAYTPGLMESQQVSDQLRANAMAFIVNNFNQIDLRPIQYLPPTVGFDLLCALQKRGH